MADFSDFLENELLDHVFRNSAYTPPAAVYLALYTAAPTDAGGGTQVSGNGYARQAITFGAAAGGAISNTSAVEFTASGGNFGTIVAVGIFDAATSGNLLAWNEITSVVINDGDTLNFPIGDIDVTLD
jgi:hypothetical protein